MLPRLTSPQKHLHHEEKVESKITQQAVTQSEQPSPVLALIIKEGAGLQSVVSDVTLKTTYMLSSQQALDLKANMQVTRTQEVMQHGQNKERTQTLHVTRYETCSDMGTT